MMYRSGWGTKAGQEIILGLRVRRDFFEDILEQSVPSTYDATRCPTYDAWRTALAVSEVRLQWDPDHSPFGEKLERRAIQLGLRGRTLKVFATTESIEVIDLTGFVASQRENVVASRLGDLQTPLEHLYVPRSAKARECVGVGADTTCNIRCNRSLRVVGACD